MQLFHKKSAPVQTEPAPAPPPAPEPDALAAAEFELHLAEELCACLDREKRSWPQRREAAARRHVDALIVVLCGEVNPAWANRFRELFASELNSVIETPAQMGLVVKETAKLGAETTLRTGKGEKKA